MERKVGPTQQLATERLGDDTALLLQRIFSKMSETDLRNFRKALKEQAAKRQEAADAVVVEEKDDTAGDDSSNAGSYNDGLIKGTQQGMSLVLNDLVVLSYKQPR